jgi:hypothetical protein
MLSFDVADMLCVVSRGVGPLMLDVTTINFDVADAESRCCRHVVCCVQGVGPLMLDVATINFDVADAESRCCRHLLLIVTNIVFSMLQMLRFDVADI